MGTAITALLPLLLIGGGGGKMMKALLMFSLLGPIGLLIGMGRGLGSMLPLLLLTGAIPGLSLGNLFGGNSGAGTQSVLV